MAENKHDKPKDIIEYFTRGNAYWRNLMDNDKPADDHRNNDELSDDPYGDSYPTAAERRAFWTDAEQFKAACEDMFKCFTTFVENQLPPEPPYPAGRGRRYYR